MSSIFGFLILAICFIAAGFVIRIAAKIVGTVIYFAVLAIVALGLVYVFF